MITAEATVTIDRPIDAVYDFLADATNDPRWCPPVEDCRRIGSSGDATSRYEATVKPGPKRMTNTFEVSTRDRPQRIRWEGSNDMADFDGHYQLEATPHGTRVKMVSNLDVRGPMRLLTPVMSVMSRRNAREQFDRLKSILEDHR